MTACAQTLHSVTESGTVNSNDTEPSSPVSRCGSQKAVSANSVRSSLPGSTFTPGAAAETVTTSAIACTSPAVVANAWTCGAGAATSL